MQTGEAIRRFLIYLAAIGRSEKTIRTYSERLQKFCCTAKINVEDVTADDLDNYVVNLRQSLAPSSVAGCVQAVKTFFRWCTQRGYVPTSPAAHLPKPKVDFNLRNKAISDADFCAMLSTARAENRTMEIAILLFLLDTGCRAGELCSLNIEDVNFDRNEAAVRGKTGTRILDFTQPTSDALKQWLDQRRQYGGDPNALFIAQNGKRLTIHGLYSRLRGLAKRAGITGRYNPHAFRHRVGQGWVDQGANLELVRLKLGHQDIRTTSLFYANQDRERQKLATERFSLVRNSEAGWNNRT